jgi:hypothetical protein
LLLEGRYTGYIQRAGANLKISPVGMCEKGPRVVDFKNGDAFLLAEDYCDRHRLAQEKRAALVDYDASLKEANKALAELRSAKSQLSSKQLISRLYQSAKELDEKVETVNEAFGKGSES